MAKSKMSKAQRRRRRKMLALIKLSAAGLVLIGIIVLVIVLIVSCSNKNAEKKSAASSQAANSSAQETALTEEETTTAKTSYRKEDYRAAGINEMGAVPILMYHRIYDMKNSETIYTGGNVDADGYNRTAEAFENDLENYYNWGYRCIRLKDFLDGNIYTEFGYSPLVITFDDGVRQARIDGFDENGDPIFSDNSALAILESFKEKHPDFNVTATFFLNAGLFENGEENDRKLLNWMIDHGYDIGNHTKTHPDLAELTEEEIEEEVGYMYSVLSDIIPGKYLDIVALPFGSPTDTSADSKFEKIFSGSYQGRHYTTSAALICGWTFESSCFSGEIDHTYVKRIRAYDNNGEEFDLEMNFSLLNDGQRFVSDGNPNSIVYPKDAGVSPTDPGEKNIIKY
ncbi:MAG: hypothetical protein E7233_01010 [Lachnospiraceae bacterium]|nr:hypothetical protein [Lachnospiraceae bacterium]